MKAVAIIPLVIGLICIISPHTAWYLRDGWKYRGAEPSDFAIGVTRVCGAACVVFAVIVFLAV